MECQDTIRSLKINFKKNINTIVLVVEGAKYEFDLFKQIFRNVLHYKFITKSRNQAEFKEYSEFVMRDNEQSKIIIINTSNSNIGSISDGDNYRNELYKILYEKYGVDIKNVPVYYIWDRDQESNPSEITKDLLGKLTNPYENDNYENGLLLLSYPCCEAYTVTNFEKNKRHLEDDAKEYVKNNFYELRKINRYTIQMAVLEMMKSLDRIKVKYDDAESYFNIDDMKNINLSTFNAEEKIFERNGYYELLSFISVIFIDLGIITFR